jgi:hypothetical protein
MVKMRIADFKEIEYEDLCADPMAVFEEVIEFCELEWTDQFRNTINNYQLKNTNYKWRQDLTEEQQQIAEHFSKQLSNNHIH